MKIFLLTTILLWASISFSLFAQSELGPPDIEPDFAGDTIIKQKLISDFAFYLKAGTSSPQGTFGSIPTRNKTPEDSFNGLDGTGARKGVAVEIGVVSLLNKFSVPDRFYPGLEAGLSFSSNNLDWSPIDEHYNTAEQHPLIFAGIKIGPSITYKPIKNFSLNAFAKLNPSLSNGPEIIYTNNDDPKNSYSYSLVSEKKYAFGLRKSYGFNLQYSKFQLGIEYSSGNIRYDLKEEFYYNYYYTYVDPYNYDSHSGVSSSEGTRTFKVKMPASMVLITIGLML